MTCSCEGSHTVDVDGKTAFLTIFNPTSNPLTVDLYFSPASSLMPAALYSVCVIFTLVACSLPCRPLIREPSAESLPLSSNLVSTNASHTQASVSPCVHITLTPTPPHPGVTANLLMCLPRLRSLLCVYLCAHVHLSMFVCVSAHGSISVVNFLMCMCVGMNICVCISAFRQFTIHTTFTQQGHFNSLPSKTQ